MEVSMEVKLQQILDFREVITIINNELKSKGIYDCEYMLINNSVEDVIHILENESECYKLVENDKYGNNITFRGLLEKYFIYVKKYYSRLLIKEGKDDEIADKYYKKLTEQTKKEGRYIIYDRSNIDMSMEEIQKTLLLMKEAVQAYYKVYNNKELIAELTTANPEKSEYFNFQIKENQLLHLLGITAGQLKNNPEFQKLTGNKNMNSIDILYWILTDIDGNNDLLQYSEDYIKKILSAKDFRINKFQQNSASQLLNYYKIRSKSQTFLKYGPFEKVSLVSKLGKNKDGIQKTLSKNSRSTVAMISRTETFKKYPWAYFGLVNNPNNQFIETLQIDSSENKKKLFMYSKPAIVKRVGIVGDDGGEHEKTFSIEDQLNLFIQAYDDFSNEMDFTNLINYFKNLSEEIKYKKEEIEKNKSGKTK